MRESNIEISRERLKKVKDLFKRNFGIVRFPKTVVQTHRPGINEEMMKRMHQTWSMRYHHDDAIVEWENILREASRFNDKTIISP